MNSTAAALWTSYSDRGDLVETHLMRGRTGLVHVRTTVTVLVEREELCSTYRAGMVIADQIPHGGYPADAENVDPSTPITCPKCAKAYVKMAEREAARQAAQ